MKTVTVGELRQNPTQALADVEAGETYSVTRHGREVARIVPPVPEQIEWIPARKPGQGSRLSTLPPLRRRSAAELDDWLADVRGDR